ncbi:hypothetical protein DdX_10739 [Ditylenchus destructor]|uniref:Uncharacterized protein n=1 Tax=Ditylenchus destructor TaxID=166010 RepID=A0AAD4MXF7_9BILA|nr:hypothetical protein DdX_10739 [Ditylenchus destructor]
MGRVGHASKRRIGRMPKPKRKVPQGMKNLDLKDSQNTKSKGRSRKAGKKPPSRQTPSPMSTNSVDDYQSHFGRHPRSNRAKTLENIHNFTKLEGWRRRSSGVTGHSRRPVRDRSCISQTSATTSDVISVCSSAEENKQSRPIELSPDDFGRMNIAESNTTPIIEEPDDEDPGTTVALRQTQRRIQLDECPAGKPLIRVKMGHVTSELCGIFKCSRCCSNNTRCFERTSRCVYCCVHETCI